MSTDSNEKSHSTFPRSSLRARNRTIVMAPADIEDFRPEPRKTKTPIRLEDIFDEGLLSQHDAPTALKKEPTNLEAESPQSPSKMLVKAEAASASLTNDIPESYAALSQDKFEVIEDPSDPGSPTESERQSFIESNEHPVHAVGTEDQTPSVAPVAKILRAADTQAPKISSPAVKPATDTWNNRGVGADTFEHDDSVDLEENMEDLLDQEQDRVIDGEREHLEVRKLSKLIGFLVSYERDHFGRYVELREGRLLVSCDGRASDNCLVISDPSVSSMHAIMRISSNGTILILDQLSEHGTRIKRCDSGKEEALLGDKGTLQHGDVVIFGECAYHVCILKGI